MRRTAIRSSPAASPRAQRARAILGAPQRVAYGPSEYEQLDIFRSATPNAPINLFVHGGAWRRNKAADYALQAEPLVRAGAHAVFIDFINVDQAGGDLLPMYEQVCRAIAWTWRNAESFGGDRERFYMSAHSSGSHLAGCALTVGLARTRPAGKFLQSCVAGERHVRANAGAAVEALGLCQIHRRHGGKAQRAAGISTACIRRSFVAHGTYETPEFQRQTRDFAAAVKAAGKPVEFLVGEGYNHFEMLETLANPYGLLGRAMLAQMRPT